MVPLRVLAKVRQHHIEKLSYFRELESRLKGRLDAGNISKEAYIGTMLTLMRGIEAEESYMARCEGRCR